MACWGHSWLPCQAALACGWGHHLSPALALDLGPSEWVGEVVFYEVGRSSPSPLTPTCREGLRLAVGPGLGDEVTSGTRGLGCLLEPSG